MIAKCSDALKVTCDSVKDEGTVTTESKKCEENCDESEESEDSKAEVTTDSVDSKAELTVMQDSSILCTKRAILIYFLLSTSLAVILSFWIV